MKHSILSNLAFLSLLGCAPVAEVASPADFITGRVTSAPDMPEAGVWVIAQTDRLPTPFRKIVVTNDAGHFVLPDLPAVQYDIWVRGYGLVDSARMQAAPGASLELTVSTAPDAQAAAAIYPASYWLSLFEVPQHSADWSNRFKLGCQLCHQVGSLMTRVRDRAGFDLGLKKASYMHVTADGLGREPLLDALADWSGRIQAGEVPQAPPRPVGIERNLVITQWSWGDAFTYAHDEIATDKRNPTLYPNGPIYGVDLGNDRVLMVDPVTHTASASNTPTLGDFAHAGHVACIHPFGVAIDQVFDRPRGRMDLFVCRPHRSASYMKSERFLTRLDYNALRNRSVGVTLAP
ncbi:MAG: carboxypeptidase regulatory-like domain-containing protein [Gammaproteobacteria bacterium]|nr:carboxypeptidase regulatory-like domain-containing protein [Gammaproteobacteria bacterium]